MKNNKQIKLNSKKRHKGLYIALGLGLSSILAGSVSAIAISIKKSHEVPSGKVLLNAGKNHKFNNQQSTRLVSAKSSNKLLDLVSNIKLLSNDSDKETTDFVGWAKTSDFKNNKVKESQIIKANAIVNEKESLTAVYANNIVNADPTRLLTVNFVRGSSASTSIITGNTKFNIISGTSLREINTPECDPKIPGELKFIGWKQKGQSALFNDSTPITTDIIFEPMMSVAAKVTFVPPTDGTITGSTTLAVAENTKFGDLNTPMVTTTDTSKVFAGWCQDVDLKTSYSPETLIKGEVKAYGKLVSATDASYVIFEAVQPASGSVTYEGNTKFAVYMDTPWKAYNRPIPISLNNEIEYWEYATDGKTWIKADGKTSFNKTTAPNGVKIRPKMKSTISGVTIQTAKNTLSVSEPIEAKGYVLPSTSVQTINWKLYSDEKCKSAVPEDQATLTTDTVAGVPTATITVLPAYKEAGKTEIYLKATSAIADQISNKQKFTLVDPFINSPDFWIERTDGWYKLSNLDKPTSKIGITKIGSTSTIDIERTEFDEKIIVGDLVTDIPPNFLSGCSKFNKEIEFKNTDPDFKFIVHDDFMNGCALFDQELPFAKMSAIGDNFMNGCVAFAQPLVLDNVVSIGQNFLAGLSNFNQLVNLTNNSVLTRIGNGFLEGCINFNQPLTLPSSITKSSLGGIGCHFMFNCDSFTETLTVNCPGDVFDKNNENLSTQTYVSPIVNTGFKVAGDKASEFPYKDMLEYPGVGCWRKVDNSQKTITAIEIETGPKSTDYKVGDVFSDNGLSITLVFEDGTKQTGVTEGWTLTMGEKTIDNSYQFKTEDIGDKKQVVVTYEGKPTTGAPNFEINVKAAEKEVETIDINTSPKTDYYVGEAFNTNGMVLVVTYVGETEPDYITSGWTTSIEEGHEFTDDEKGLHTVVVTYGNKTTNLPITVSDQPVSEVDHIAVNVDASTHKTVFTPNETFSRTGLAVTVYYKAPEGQAGTAETITDPAKFTTDFDGKSVGEASADPKTVTVTLVADTSKKCTYDITVTDATDFPDYLAYEETGTTTISVKAAATGFEETSLTINSHYKMKDGSIKTVTGICANGFYEKTTISSLSLPNTLKTIGNNAFYGCESLENNFNLPNSLETIGDNAFLKCNATEATIPENVKYIGANFIELTGEDVSLKFASALVGTIWTYPKDKGLGTFSPTGVPETDTAAYKAEDQVNHRALTRVEDVTVLPDYFQLGDDGVLMTNSEVAPQAGSELTIKNKYLVEGQIKEVKTIGNCSGLSNTTKLVISSGITTIKADAFSADTDKNIATVVIGADVTSIGRLAFNTTGNLSSLTFEDSTKKWELKKEESETLEFTPSTAAYNADYYKADEHYSYDWTKVEEKKTTKKAFIEKVTAWVDNGSMSGSAGEYTVDQIKNVHVNGTLVDSVDQIEYGASNTDCSIKVTVSGESKDLYLYDAFINSENLTTNLKEETVETVTYTITDDYIDYVDTKATSGAINHIRISKNGYLLIYSLQDGDENYSLEYDGDPK